MICLLLNDKPQQSQDLRPYSWFMALLIILHHIADPDGKENETSGQPFATKISLATAWSQRSINLNQSCHLCIRLDRGWYESPGILQKQTNKQTKKKQKKLSRKSWGISIFYLILCFNCAGSLLMCVCFLVVESRDCSLTAVCGLLVAMASLIVERRL